MEIIKKMFEDSPITVIVLIIAIGLYFFFEQKSKNKNKKSSKEIREMTQEERAEYKKIKKQAEIKRTKKIKNNTSKRVSNVYDERHYESAPKDGTSLYQKGASRVSYKNKKARAGAMERLPEYEHYLNEVREKNLNHLARNLEMINNDCTDDIYYFQKLGYFKNVEINESSCRIFYKDQAFNSEFVNEEEKNAFEELGKDNPYEILKTDFEGEHVPGVNITHVCPHCGTPNIIDTDTSEYNCYYCLDKVIVKGKNKK